MGVREPRSYPKKGEGTKKGGPIYNNRTHWINGYGLHKFVPKQIKGYEEEGSDLQQSDPLEQWVRFTYLGPKQMQGYEEEGSDLQQSDPLEQWVRFTYLGPKQ
jgi:hypothetical protein